MSTTAPPLEKPEPNKKAIEDCKKLINIAGGVPPQLLIAPPSKRSASEPAQPKLVAKWSYAPFDIESRSDGLKLRHWQKEGVPYPFGKLGKKLDIIKYTDQEYEELLAELNPSWSKEETDLLWKLCEQYELRFVVIADRFAAYPEYKRSIEELKDRYFSIAKCLLEARGETSNQLVRKPFNFDYEVKRKANMEKIFLRTAEHQMAERQLLEEAKKVEQKIKKEEKEQKNLNKLMNKEDGIEGESDTFSTYRRPTFVTKPAALIKQPPFAVVSTGGESSPCHSPSGRGGRRDRGSGVYLRSQLMNAPLPIPEKAQKKLNQVLVKELGVPEKLVPTAAVVRLYDQLRKEVLSLLGLEMHAKKKERERQHLEQKWEEYQKRLKAAQAAPGGPMPNQPMGPMMMPPGSSHMINSSAVPFPQNMSGHMQQIPNPSGVHHPYSMPMHMQHPMGHSGHVPHPRMHHGQTYEGDRTGDASAIGHPRLVPVTAPISQPTPPPEVAQAPTATPLKVERNEERIKTEEKPETPVPDKKRGKRKPRSDRKGKRAVAEGSTPDSSVDKKKKKH